MSTEPSISLGLSKRLGELLVASGLISPGHLEEALEAQRREGGKLGTLLVQKGCIKEGDLLAFLGQQCGIAYISLEEIEAVPPEAIQKVPEGIARRQILIPISINHDTITIAMADPLNVMVLDDLKVMTGCEIRMVLASEKEIKAALDKFYAVKYEKGAMQDLLEKASNGTGGAEVDVVKESGEEAGGDTIITLGAKGEDAPVIQWVNLLLANAIRSKTSDIHIEPYNKSLRIRYRIDGVLHEQPSPSKKFLNAIVSRLKIMANLDISEKRLPQDGRIRLKIDNKEVDLRVSILPCAPGEKVVMRILDSSGLKLNLEDLAMEPESLSIFKKSITAPHGMVLITGPTGSGKSTTLYTTLGILNTPDTNISTVEDPVEYVLEGINQVQVNTEIGLTFAAALRSFLRQDPDIILVGEIRDPETVAIAINAALTGHLVFATLHTNDAPSSITRLTTMGIEPFLISATLNCVVSQRLMRVVCSKCREEYEVDSAWLAKLGVSPELFGDKGKVRLARGKGCDNCSLTGYRGRCGIHEVMEVTDSIRALINQRASAQVIQQQALKEGMITLRQSAVRKMLRGVTTVEETLRVSG